MITIAIGDKTLTVTRSKLKKWLLLEDIKDAILEAVEHKDRQKFEDALYLYVSTAFDVEKDKVKEVFWKEIYIAFSVQEEANRLKVDYLASMRPGKKDDEVHSWEYAGRTWWHWADMFCKRYNWNIEYVENLDPLHAVHLFQEILLEDQFEKEWQWSLSPHFTGYDPKTKQTKLNHFPKPDWMRSIKKPPILTGKPAPIPESMMPIGVIIHAPTKPQ